MNPLARYACSIAVAALAGGCAGFEQALLPIAPSGAASPASLLGHWTSSSSIGAGLNSCTNLQWRITGQQGNAVSGDFSTVCGPVTASGTVSGQLNGNDVPYRLTGSATLAGGAPCPVSVSGTARLEGDSIRVPYSGSTCLGPAQGEEVLRRRVPDAPRPPSPPAPSPNPTPEPVAPPPAQPPSAFHVEAGPTTCSRAERVVNATADEFPGLTAPRASESDAVNASAELLRRMIWHLQLAGYQAGRQRNPSGAISNDKVTIHCNGVWHAYDLFRDLGGAGRPADVIFLEVFPPDPVADAGVPD
jgi:hypothetical protein